MSRTPHLVRSSFLVFFIFGLDKITGFVKLLLTTRLFGTGPEVDAFATANQLPELLLAMLAAGALSAALIPVYSGYLTHSQRSEAASLAGTVLTLTMIVMGAACLLAIAAAPWLIRVVLAPHFPAETQQITAQMMRIFLLAAVLISVSGVFGSLLHAHQHFLTPALGRVLIDLGQIVGLFVLVPLWGVYGMAWGSVLGAMLTVLVQLPSLGRHRVRLRLQIDLRLQGSAGSAAANGAAGRDSRRVPGGRPGLYPPGVSASGWQHCLLLLCHVGDAVDAKVPLRRRHFSSDFPDNG